MALFKLTYLELQNEARHAIGGTPDSRVTLSSLVNGALERLCSMHTWSWRVVLTTLSTTINVGTIDLPDDFGELIDLVGNQLKFSAVRKASYRTIARVRVYGLQSDLSLLYYIGQKAQATAATVPLRQLVMAPIPSVSTVDAFYLTYRKQIPMLAGDTDVPAIPYSLFEPLRWLVRGWAKLQTIGDGGADMAMFENLIRDYIAQDSLVDGPRAGELCDVVEEIDPDGVYRLAPHSSIEMPGDP